MATPVRQTSGGPDRETVAAGIQAVREACCAHGLQFTTIRSAVLEAIWEVGQPVGAYELIRLLKVKLQRPVSPPTVYRSLDFLLNHGFIARIETKNAFVPCTAPQHDRAGMFFICESCGSSEEVENKRIEALFEQDAAGLGFRIGKRVVELQGTCANCLATHPASG